MRIVHATSTFLPVANGAEIVIHSLASKQAATGHDVCVLAPQGQGALPYPLPYRVIRPTWFRRPLFVSARWGLAQALAAPFVAELQRRHRFDVWHLHFLWPTGAVVGPTLRRLRVPMVGTPHGTDVQTVPEVGYGYRLDPRVEARLPQVVACIDRLTAFNEQICATLGDLGVPPTRISTIPNGIDTNRFELEDFDRAAFRRSRGWPEDRLLILVVGRNDRVKGGDRLPAVLDHLRGRGTPFCCVVAGTGWQDLAEQLQCRGLEDSFHACGPIGWDAASPPMLPPPELIKIYLAADIFVSLTRAESFGLTLAEALAAGLPIVATRVPGVEQLLTDGDNALLVDGDQPAQAAEAIARLHDDAKLRQRLVARGRELVAGYELSAVNDQYLALYRELADAR